MSDNFLFGSPVLHGSATTPGVPIPEELGKHIPTIFQACRDFGLDFYPTIVQMLSHDEMSEIASYGGFAVRYPHWKFGAEYEEMQRGYLYGNHRIYELVINSSPCYLYCLNSNTLLDNITVIAHALGHCHFFKNNIYFSKTNTNAHNELANNGSNVRKYMSRYGQEEVGEFMDMLMRVETLVDPTRIWKERVAKEVVIRDKKEYVFPKRINTNHDYMEDWVNTKEFIDYQNKKIEEKELIREMNILDHPETDIFGYIKDHAPFRPWQRDIAEILYNEAIYFSPQGKTKAGNEGFACLRSGQYIFTDKGMIKIDEIVKNKINCNTNDFNKNQKIVNHFVHENKTTYKITTKRGFIIDGSDTHRIWDANKNWKRLDEFNVGDKVFIHAGANIWAKNYVKINYVHKERMKCKDIAALCGCSFDTVRRRMNGENTRINEKLDCTIREYKNQFEKFSGKHVARIDAKIPEIVDEDFARFLGYLIGDGHISVKSRSFGLTSADIESVNDFAQLCKNLFNIRCVVKKVPGKYRVYAYSRKLEHFFISLGLKTGISARSKNIPDCILKSPKNVIANFLKSLFDCDGYGGNGGVILSTSSKEMASQIQLLLLNFGIIASIGKQPKDILHVRLGGAYCKIFLNEIGFGLSRKQKSLQSFIDNHQWFLKQEPVDDIVQIEKSQDTVYDISVENTHRYSAQGFINHNSWVDYNIIAKQGYCGLGQENYDDGIVEYAIHKAGVLGGKYSTNPYKLGFTLLTDIEERWNKGKFGIEYEQCTNELQKEEWDLKLGLGKEKVFEVCKNYDDYQLINEFFTKDFCEKYEFFEYKRYPTGEIKIESRDHKKIKKNLLKKYINRGLPNIRLVAPRLKGHIFFMEHVWDGLEIYRPYALEVIRSIAWLMKSSVALQTKNHNQEDIVYYLDGNSGNFVDQDVQTMSKAQFLKV